MKTKYLMLLILLVVCQSGFSQKGVNQLFKEFTKSKDIKTVSFDGFTMSIANLFTDTMGVDGVDIYELNDCDSKTLEKFAKEVKQLKDSKYETMINSSEDTNRTKVLVKIEDEIIRELVVVTSGNNNALIRIKGYIKPSDIERIMQKHTNG